MRRRQIQRSIGADDYELVTFGDSLPQRRKNVAALPSLLSRALAVRERLLVTVTNAESAKKEIAVSRRA